MQTPIFEVLNPKNGFMTYNKNEKECWASIATSPSQVKSIVSQKREVVNKPETHEIEVTKKEQMSLEDQKKKVRDYLQLSGGKKESMRLISIYEKELNEFYSEKLKISIAGTLILQGY